MTNRTKILLTTVLFLTASVFSIGDAFAQTNDTKPGWGFGDNNHIHTGPPGQSVRPGHEHHLQHLIFKAELERLIARFRLSLLHSIFNRA